MGMLTAYKVRRIRNLQLGGGSRMVRRGRATMDVRGRNSWTVIALAVALSIGGVPAGHGHAGPVRRVAAVVRRLLQAGLKLLQGEARKLLRAAARVAAVEARTRMPEHPI